MNSTPIARYRMRALMAASCIGILIGAAIGSAYIGGHLAQDSSVRRDAGRLRQLTAMSQDGSIDLANLELIDQSEGKAAASVNPTAMALAMRYTNYAGVMTAGAPLSQKLTAQNLTAQNLSSLRVSTDMRERTTLMRANMTMDGTAMALASASLMRDHPVRAAQAMVFKGHSQSDSDCLTQAVYYEARGEGVDGMRAVAQVILNRVRHPAYPKSICGVVYQGAYQRSSCQFSFVCDGSMSAPLEAWAWRRAKAVSDAALSGYVMKSVGTATSFHTVSVAPIWSDTMDRVTTVGSHIFYQFKGGRSQIARSLDGIRPSNGVPSLTPILVNDTTTVPGDTTATATQAISAADKSVLIAALNHMDSPTTKPVTASAHITGRSAQDITAEVAMPAATAKPAAIKTAAVVSGTTVRAALETKSAQ